jgi:4-hydroxy-L-threonine phosphate dehydrogenase PdxA
MTPSITPNMADHVNPSSLQGPATAQACRARLAVLQGDIASIRLQIATADMRRQAQKQSVDAAWFHRAKTAMRLKQQEQAMIHAQLAQLNASNPTKPRELIKDAIIEVVRADCDDAQWGSVLQRAKARVEQSNQAIGGAHG